MRAIVKIMFIGNTDSPEEDIESAVEDGAEENKYSIDSYEFEHKADVYYKLTKGQREKNNR